MTIKTFNGREIALDLPELPENFNPANLVALPALVDPHVHFRVPGLEHKEDWVTGARAALAGGVTTVLEMPNTAPPTTTAAALYAKKKLIDQQLVAAGIPLRYSLYFGATPDNAEEIKKVKNEIVGLKLFLGSSTGNLLVEKTADQEKIFALAAELGLIVAVHAEDNESIKYKVSSIKYPIVYDHSRIRGAEIAARSVGQAISLIKRYGAKLYILHVSTAAELKLIRAAKQAGLPVYAEATPHHLFLTTDDYAALGTRAQMNPPLRSPADQTALWEAVNDGTIDCLGTDHAPHTLAEKNLPYPQSPSGIPGLETALPLLLNACHQGKIGLEKIVALTSANARRIFGLPETNDWVIVDLNLEREVKNENLKTKCGWSPFNGWRLTGWPVATILDNKAYTLKI